jgi:hypothetical protein
MKTYKNISILILSLTISISVLAQKKKGNPSKEKIQAMKVAYITEKINLTPGEAEKFWPIYNEFEAKMNEFHKARRKIHKKEAMIDEMTDAAVEDMIKSIQNNRQKELNLEKEYHAKFKAVIPVKKIAKLHKANHDFKRDLLKKIKNHKGGPEGHRGPPHGGPR